MVFRRARLFVPALSAACLLHAALPASDDVAAWRRNAFFALAKSLLSNPERAQSDRMPVCILAGHAFYRIPTKGFPEMDHCRLWRGGPAFSFCKSPVRPVSLRAGDFDRPVSSVLSDRRFCYEKQKDQPLFHLHEQTFLCDFPVAACCDEPDAWAVSGPFTDALAGVSAFDWHISPDLSVFRYCSASKSNGDRQQMVFEIAGGLLQKINSLNFFTARVRKIPASSHSGTRSCSPAPQT